MKWTKNRDEVWYLAAIAIASLALSLPRMNMRLSTFDFDVLDPLEMLSFLPTLLFTLLSFLILFLVPASPHIPAFLYGMYTQNNKTTEGMPIRKDNYRLALSVSVLLSLFVTKRLALSISMPLYALVKLSIFVTKRLVLSISLRLYLLIERSYIFEAVSYRSLVLSIDLIIVVTALLIPILHVYYEYERHGKIREVVLLVLIYAPWVQFVRMLTVYAQFL